MPVDKAGLLDAVAAAGSQGRKDFEAAQAANAAAQAEAIRMALSGSLAGSAPPEAAGLLSATIAKPYQLAGTRLSEQSAASNDWFNRLGANANQWGTVMQGLNEAVTARALAEAAAGGGGGSGGGGSGGGGSGGGDTGDWYSNLKDLYGTADIGKKAIAAEAKNLYSWKDTHMSPYEYAQKYAEDKYGVPAGVAASWYTQSKDDAKFAAAIPKAVSKVANKRQARKVIGQARAQARSMPGPQKYLVAQVREKARAQAAQAAARRKKQRR